MGRRPPLYRKLPRRGTLTARTASRLREAILRGEIDTQRPLREVELARKLGVSRVPLREAFHQLEGEGLLEIRPHRGAVVTRLSRAEVIELAEICRLLEGHALRLAIPNLTPEVLDRAGEVADRMDRAKGPVEWSRLNWRFHATLYEPAVRPRLIELVAVLRANAERYIFMLIGDEQRRRALNREHRSILSACRRRRAKQAVGLLDAHLEGGKEKVLRLLADS